MDCSRNGASILLVSVPVGTGSRLQAEGWGNDRYRWRHWRVRRAAAVCRPRQVWTRSLSAAVWRTRTRVGRG